MGEGFLNDGRRASAIGIPKSVMGSVCRLPCRFLANARSLLSRAVRGNIDEKRRSSARITACSCTAECAAQRIYRDTHAARIYDGATDILKLVVARTLMK